MRNWIERMWKRKADNELYQLVMNDWINAITDNKKMNPSSPFHPGLDKRRNILDDCRKKNKSTNPRREYRKLYARTHRKQQTAAAYRWRQERYDYYTASRYGITEEDYRKLMNKPCWICGKPADVLDRSRLTGKVRKALCRSHNIGLGAFQDSPLMLLKAFIYLVWHLLPTAGRVPKHGLQTKK